MLHTAAHLQRNRGHLPSSLTTPMSQEHPLEKMFALPASAILDVIHRNNRLLVAVKGGIAQEHLRHYLAKSRDTRQITDFGSPVEEGKSDFWVLFEARRYLVECKNVQKTLRGGEITVDFMRTRYAKTVGPQGRFYKPSEFQVLAACLFNQTNVWEFRFIATTSFLAIGPIVAALTIESPWENPRPIMDTGARI